MYVRRRRERSPDGPHRHDRKEECLDRPRDLLPTRVDLCPPLPTSFEAALDEALVALGIALSPPARAAIDGHVRLLLAWNEAINLTAIRDPASVAVRHVADSLTALAALRAHGVDRFLDLGSGGGFPGLPLAAALPAERAVLVDSIAKKVRFLATTVAATGLADRVEALAARAETLATEPRHRGRWPAITARAVTSVAELVELGLPLLVPGGMLVAWKRGETDSPTGLGAEIAAARHALAAIDPGARLEVEPAIPAEAPLVELAGHRLVIVTRGPAPIDWAWPRDPAARRRRPW